MLGRAVALLTAVLATAAASCQAEPERSPAGAGAAASPKAAKVDETEVRKAAWLRSALTGRDNPAARIRKAQISQDEGGGFKLFIQNQMAMTCGLVFGSDGRPAELTLRAGAATACVGPEGWRSREQSIKLECTEADGAETCRGNYRLSSPNGFADPAVLEIIRPLAATAAGSVAAPETGSGASPCQGLRCRAQPEGAAACVQVSDRPGDQVLCVCRSGAPVNTGSCPPGATCQDANDGKAACKAR